MERPTLSIVVPTYNEEGNVRAFHERVAGALSGRVASFELLFVDDGSTDRTAEIVEGLHERDARVGLVQLSRNFGHQAALMAGLDLARGDAVVAMDADLEHPPELLPELVARWRAGAEVVQTARTYATGTGWLKRLTSRAFYGLFRKLAEIPVVPGAADFFLLDRRALEALNRCRESPRFTRGLVSWIGFRRDLVPYASEPRRVGVSKYSPAKMVRFALDAIFAFSVTPLRFAGALGLLAAALGFAYLLYAAAIRVFGSGATPGWASLVAVVVLMGGVQLTTLWVMGEYVARMAGQARERPPYLISRTLGPQEPGE